MVNDLDDLSFYQGSMFIHPYKEQTIVLLPGNVPFEKDIFN